MADTTGARVTVDRLRGGLYAGAEANANLADYGSRRYHPFSFDFDSTPMSLEEPGEHWEEKVRELHLQNRERMIERLKETYGTQRHELVVQNIRDLGNKAFSLISYHNQMHHQSREAFVIGAYYPALVGVCALGERILNHLVLDLRDSYKDSEHYKKVHRKDSFDSWEAMVRVLSDWGVLVDGVAAEFLSLARIRHSSVHFNPETYGSLRTDALAALKQLGKIIAKQFGAYGGQPWFIPGTPGAQFIKREFEAVPFVRTYIVPLSGFVGVEFGMDLRPEGHWMHLDYHDYGDEVLDDAAFARAYHDRDPAKIVTRQMIERGPVEEHDS